MRVAINLTDFSTTSNGSANWISLQPSSSSSSCAGSSSRWICFESAPRVLSLGAGIVRNRDQVAVGICNEPQMPTWRVSNSPLLCQFGNYRSVVIGNRSERGSFAFYHLFEHFAELHDLCRCIMSPGPRDIAFDESLCAWNVPCIVSDIFSNDRGFCFITNFPFLSSTSDMRSGFSSAITVHDK